MRIRNTLMAAALVMPATAGILAVDATAKPAPAEAGIMVCTTQAKAPVKITPTTIVGSGSTTCYGSVAGARVETQCQVQERFGAFPFYRWVTVYGGTTSTGPKGCTAYRPKGDGGRFRTRARNVIVAPGFTKNSGWDQSYAVDVR